MLLLAAPLKLRVGGPVLGVDRVVPDADPRPAVAERYGSRDDYLRRVRAAARVLVEDGYLLEEDVETSLAFAARMWEAWA